MEADEGSDTDNDDDGDEDDRAGGTVVNGIKLS